MFAEGLYTACQPAQAGPASLLISQSSEAVLLFSLQAGLRLCGPRVDLLSLGAETLQRPSAWVSGEGRSFISSSFLHSTCKDRASFMHESLY